MPKNFVVILSFIFTAACFSQSNKPHADAAYPALGWDSLKNLMEYPELARRAGVEGVSNVAVKIDSVGNVVDVIISGIPIFNAAIENAVREVTWQPDIANYKQRSSTVFFDVQFQYKDSKIPVKRTLVIEADKPH